MVVCRANIQRLPTNGKDIKKPTVNAAGWSLNQFVILNSMAVNVHVLSVIVLMRYVVKFCPFTQGLASVREHRARTRHSKVLLEISARLMLLV